jgi:hypothetical protein
MLRSEIEVVRVKIPNSYLSAFTRFDDVGQKKHSACITWLLRVEDRHFRVGEPLLFLFIWLHTTCRQLKRKRLE